MADILRPRFLEEAHAALAAHDQECSVCRAYRHGRRHSRCHEGARLARIAAGERP